MILLDAFLVNRYVLRVRFTSNFYDMIATFLRTHTNSGLPDDQIT